MRVHSAPHRSAVRMAQAAAVARFVAAQDRSAHRAVLTGDCNPRTKADRDGRVSG